MTLLTTRVQRADSNHQHISVTAKKKKKYIESTRATLILRDQTRTIARNQIKTTRRAETVRSYRKRCDGQRPATFTCTLVRGALGKDGLGIVQVAHFGLATPQRYELTRTRNFWTPA